MTKVIEGKTFNYNLGAMKTYHVKLNQLINPMMAKTDEIMLSNFEDYKKGFIVQEQLPIKIQSELNEEEENQKTLFVLLGSQLYDEYIQDLNKNSLFNVRKNIRFFRDSSNIEENRDNIQTIEESSKNEFMNFMMGIVIFYFLKMKKKASETILSGDDSALKKYLSSQRRITRKRAKYQLDDNYRETFNALNRARMEANGLTKWQWVYTYRSKTERPYHVNVLRNQIFDIKKSPPLIDPKTKEHGFPGQLPNCKCRMRPIVEI